MVDFSTEELLVIGAGFVPLAIYWCIITYKALLDAVSNGVRPFSLIAYFCKPHDPNQTDNSRSAWELAAIVNEIKQESREKALEDEETRELFDAGVSCFDFKLAFARWVPWALLAIEFFQLTGFAFDINIPWPTFDVDVTLLNNIFGALSLDFNLDTDVNVAYAVFMSLLSAHVLLIPTFVYSGYVAKKEGWLDYILKGQSVDQQVDNMMELYDKQTAPSMRTTMVNSGMAEKDVDDYMETARKDYMESLRNSVKKTGGTWQLIKGVWRVFSQKASVQFATDVLFIPTLRASFSILDCVTVANPAGGDDVYLLEKNPSIECWTGNHIIFAGLAVVLICAVYPLQLATALSSPFNNPDVHDKVVKLPRVVVTTVVLKAMLSGINTLLSKNTTIQVSFLVVMMTILAGDQLWSQPALGFTKKGFNTWHSASLGGAWWAQVGAVIAVVLDDRENTLSFFVYAGGLVPVMIGASYLSKWRARYIGIQVDSEPRTVPMLESNNEDSRSKMMSALSTLLGGDDKEKYGPPLLHKEGFAEVLIGHFRDVPDQDPDEWSYHAATYTTGPVIQAFCRNSHGRDKFLDVLENSNDVEGMVIPLIRSLPFTIMDSTMIATYEVSARGSSPSAQYMAKHLEQDRQAKEWVRKHALPAARERSGTKDAIAGCIVRLKKRVPDESFDKGVSLSSIKPKLTRDKSRSGEDASSQPESDVDSDGDQVGSRLRRMGGKLKDKGRRGREPKPEDSKGSGSYSDDQVDGRIRHGRRDDAEGTRGDSRSTRPTSTSFFGSFFAGDNDTRQSSHRNDDGDSYDSGYYDSDGSYSDRGRYRDSRRSGKQGRAQRDGGGIGSWFGF